MEVRSFNCELGISNLLFKKLFNNIQIERSDDNGNKKLIPVKCVLGQRSRIFKNWQNAEKRSQMKLPMIIINRNGYSKDPQRLNNLHNEVKYEITSKNRVYDYMTPVPININYEVTIVAKYPSDIDQIASNFMVFFNASLYVSCIHPKYDDVKMNNQVVMEDSVSEEHPDEFDGSQDDLITSTFNFTFKTFLFAGIKQAKKVPQQVLSSFTSSFISSEVIVLQPSEIDDFQKEYPYSEVSAALTSEVTAEVTSYVDNPDISDDVYEEFAPVIKKIEVGFYPTPLISGFEEYMYEVDNVLPDKIYKELGYISSKSYTSAYEEYVAEDGSISSRISAIIPNAPHKSQIVDVHETIAPYKDRLIWKIDETSTAEFADNVGVYRRFQV